MEGLWEPFSSFGGGGGVEEEDDEQKRTLENVGGTAVSDAAGRLDSSRSCRRHNILFSTFGEI